MNPTLYQTFKQLKRGQPPVYIMVIAIVFKAEECVRIDLLNLDGKLDTSSITTSDFKKLLQDGVIVEWKPG